MTKGGRFSQPKYRQLGTKNQEPRTKNQEPRTNNWPPATDHSLSPLRAACVRASGYQAVLERVDRGLGAVAHLQLLEDTCDVVLYRLLGKEQPVADLAVACPLSYQRKYLQLTVG